MFKVKIIALIIVLLAAHVFSQAQLPDVAGVTGAQVNNEIKIMVHVDQLNGNDNNNGLSQTTALKSLKAGMNRAIAELKNGVATRLLIHPGIYRESLGALNFGAT